MMRTAAKLAVIFAVVTAGVHFGYRRLEEELGKASCVPPPVGEEGTAAQPQEVPESAGAVNAEDAPPPDATALADFQVIVRRNIFQVKQEAPPPPPVKPQTPQQQQPAALTALNLVLAGTVTGTEETARAIIIDNTGKKEQLLLRVGDGVQGAIIKAIDWNSVTLDVNGKLEILKMPEINPGAPGQSSAGGTRPFQPPPSFHAGPDMEAMRGMPSARPNRRVNLPLDYENPPEEEPHIEEPHMDEPPPEQPEIGIEEQPFPPEEEPSPELPPMDVE
uniref:type II secretion system protein N n=1 Tax=Candidatus Electronema sp. TaxID=2698783 RepID=UPI004056BC1C